MGLNSELKIIDAGVSESLDNAKGYVSEKFGNTKDYISDKCYNTFGYPQPKKTIAENTWDHIKFIPEKYIDTDRLKKDISKGFGNAKEYLSE